jgi:hypothetical protein
VNVSWLNPSCDAKQSSLACACCCGCGSLWSGCYPWIDWVTAFAGLALATTVWVIDRVHDHTANGWANTIQRFTPALRRRRLCALHWQLHQWWRGIRCGSCEPHQGAYAPGRTCLHEPATLRRCQRAGDLGIADLHAMDRGTHWNVADRQRVAPTRIGASDQRGTNFKATWGDDVGALAVCVADQAMWAVRLGSYSMRSTLAGMASLLRLKSTTR